MVLVLVDYFGLGSFGGFVFCLEIVIVVCR